MSAGTSRRNGKQASCEPCRKGKIRCDHQRPICDRCHRRGMESQCWYHPAPLSKPRTGRDRTVGVDNPNTLSGPSPRNTRNLQQTGTTDTHRAIELTVNTPGGSPPGGAILPPIEPGVASPGPGPPTTTAGDHTRHSHRVELVVELLGHLKHLTLIQKLLEEYYTISQAGVVPGPLVLLAVSTLRNQSSYVLGTTEGDSGSVSQLAVSVLRSTALEVDVSPSVTSSEFLACYTGERLRLETIGLIYNIAARSCWLGLSRDDEKRDGFLQSMLQSSNDCLRLARDIAPQVNDMTVWLAYENILLTIVTQEDTSMFNTEGCLFNSSC